MHTREVEKRLIMILPSTERNCWINKQECPYGKPDGQFQNRPLAFCKISVCQNLQDHIEEFREVSEAGEVIEERAHERIEEILNSKKVLLSTELRILSEYIDNKTAKLLTILTADLIETSKDIVDIEIIRVNDF